MIYTSWYDSPLGKMLISADEECVTGLWFDEQKYFPQSPGKNGESCRTEIASRASSGAGWHANASSRENGESCRAEIASRASSGADRRAEGSGDVAAITEAKRWLDIYFAGSEPDFMPPIRLGGSPFRQEVGQIMLKIPYGETITYGQIAGVIAKRRGGGRMSAQAVGGAVGHNPISVIVPCHRVVGAGGNLTGYAGGLARKKALLMLEGALR